MTTKSNNYSFYDEWCRDFGPGWKNRPQYLNSRIHYYPRKPLESSFFYTNYSYFHDQLIYFAKIFNYPHVDMFLTHYMDGQLQDVCPDPFDFNKFSDHDETMKAFHHGAYFGYSPSYPPTNLGQPFMVIEGVISKRSWEDKLNPSRLHHTLHVIIDNKTIQFHISISEALIMNINGLAEGSKITIITSINPLGPLLIPRKSINGYPNSLFGLHTPCIHFKIGPEKPNLNGHEGTIFREDLQALLQQTIAASHVLEQAIIDCQRHLGDLPGLQAAMFG